LSNTVFDDGLGLGRLSGDETGRTNTASTKGGNLIMDERDKRRDDDAQSALYQSRKLEAQ